MIFRLLYVPLLFQQYGSYFTLGVDVRMSSHCFKRIRACYDHGLLVLITLNN